MGEYVYTHQKADTLGGRIAHARIDRGMRQAELAEKAKINRSSLGVYEAGHNNPSLDKLARIAKALGVTTDYLITGEE